MLDMSGINVPDMIKLSEFLKYKTSLRKIEFGFCPSCYSLLVNSYSVTESYLILSPQYLLYSIVYLF